MLICGHWVNVRLISIYCLWGLNEIDFLWIFVYNMYVGLIVILLGSKYGITFSCFHLDVTWSVACIKILWSRRSYHLIVVQQWSCSRRLFVNILWRSLWLCRLLLAIKLRVDDSMRACCLTERLLLLYLALIVEGKRFSFFIVLWFALRWVAVWIVMRRIILLRTQYLLTLVLFFLRAVNWGWLRSHWWLVRLLKKQVWLIYCHLVSRRSTLIVRWSEPILGFCLLQ